MTASRGTGILAVPRGHALPSFWTLQLLGWSGYYVAMAFSRIGRFPLSYMLAEKLLLTLLGVIISLALRAVLRRMLAEQRSMTALVVTSVAASYLLAALWTAAANVLTIPIQTAFLGRAVKYDSVGMLFGGTVYNSFTLVAWAFLYLGLTHYVALQAERERALRAETMVAEVKLRALQHQLNPHLFFNTLNAISTLIAERRNDDATVMIARLGDFLRATLRQDLAPEVPLAEELSLVAQYLDIEHVRFGERLRVTYDIDEEAYREFVPLLLLQPLVENATRHGIGRLETGGTIAISARVVGERLEVAVENSAPVKSNAVAEAGIGLANVRERLAVLYGDRHELTISNADGVFRVDIKVPITAGTHRRSQLTGDAVALGV
ncbi:MAG: histidine kinase internal region [Gemmatimonadetes bacterium]|nr:histidine kinase internal region [Gemmatimonadota bacterium]